MTIDQVKTVLKNLNQRFRLISQSLQVGLLIQGRSNAYYEKSFEFNEKKNKKSELIWASTREFIMSFRLMKSNVIIQTSDVIKKLN